MAMFTFLTQEEVTQGKTMAGSEVREAPDGKCETQRLVGREGELKSKVVSEFLGARELSKVQHMVRTHQDVLVRGTRERDKLIRKASHGAREMASTGTGNQSLSSH